MIAQQVLTETFMSAISKAEWHIYASVNYALTGSDNDL